MLENTQIFETAENKELDTLLKKYNDLKVTIDDMTKTKNQIADRIKELCGEQSGKYETLNFVFSLVKRAGSTSIKAKALMENYPKIWEQIGKTKGVVSFSNPSLCMGDIVSKDKV